MVKNKNRKFYPELAMLPGAPFGLLGYAQGVKKSTDKYSKGAVEKNKKQK